jgi:hypothetical protein
MLRTVTFRLAAAFAAVVFAVTSGVTGMEAHPLSAHGPHAAEMIALELGGAGQPAQAGHTHARHASDHEAGGHSAPGAPAGPSSHSGHPQHGSSQECTCVGPCAGAAPPTLSDPAFGEIRLGETDCVRTIPALGRLIPQDPRSYLLPLPNAPPERV